jgi:hypothetical protein
MSYLDKLQGLRNDLDKTILSLIQDKGVKSDHSNLRVLKVDADDMINLEGGRWLTEITMLTIIDNEGYEYNLDVITFEELARIVDNLTD